MDIALVITTLLFVAAFIAAGLIIQFTTIRNLKEKIREMDEDMGQNYSCAADADRTLRQELSQTQTNLRWAEAELEVRKFLMRDPQRMRELAQAGHLDRQNWLINQGTQIFMEENEVSNITRLIRWWERAKANNYNI